MTPELTKLACGIITGSSRAKPADEVLRLTLKGQPGLSREEGGQVSRAVFAYYRWFGWLERATPLASQLEQALELRNVFAHQPESFSETELVERAVPGWVPSEMDVTPAWSRWLQGEPKVWLRARPGTGRALAEKLGSSRMFGAGLLEDILEYQGSEDLFRTPEFQAGEFELQDLNSQAVGLVCDPKGGQTWWDACAGEGGKLLHLSDLMNNKGMIWATDRAAWRLKKLSRRAARAKVFNYRARLWDSPGLPTKTRFDGVLLDAPCSGMGTWQRNPHARWTTTPEDLQELADLQRRLLGQVAGAVNPGGRLIYSVCTLARTENATVVDSFEKENPDFKPMEVMDPLAYEAPASPRLALRPEQNGGNGMFVAVWRRQDPNEP